MSSSSTATSTASAATPTQSSSGNSTTDATLYLYTFLATLVLLLAVSSAIVVRSLMLRRRHQRLVEEAIRTGTWLPRRFDSAGTRRRRDFGQKPTLWEARVAHESDGDGDIGDCDISEKSRWMDICPVYAAYVCPHSPATHPVQAALGAATVPDSGVSRARFMWPFAPRGSPPSTQPAIASLSSSTPSLTPPSPPSTTGPRTLRVGVLVAMPRPSHAHIHAQEGTGPPVVEIGVAETIVTDDGPQNDG